MKKPDDTSSSQGDTPLVTVEQLGPITKISFNRPEVHNVFSVELLEETVGALEDVVSDSDASVVILAGLGKGFSAGADLAQQTRGSGVGADRERLRRTYRLFDAVFNLPIPTIAAVHGFALGAGADLALHCDFLLMAEDAVIGHPGVRGIGVPPTNMWMYRLGPQLAKRLLMTGDRVSGVEAARIGLALYACKDAELDEVAMQLARRLSLAGRDCLIGNKSVINRGLDLMGRVTLNEFARIEDVIGHLSETNEAFARAAAEHGVAQAARERDSAYQPEASRLSGPWTSETAW